MLNISEPLWDPHPRRKSSYDAVLIGGGLHSLATAYFLARDHGMTDVAVVEKRFLGFGGAALSQRRQDHAPLGRTCRHDAGHGTRHRRQRPVEGFYLNCGWGYFGFKSSTAAGKHLARFLATGECPDILKPFTARRYEEHRLMGETAGAISYGPWN